MIECLTNPVWVTPEVENSPDDCQVPLDRVVHGIGETLGQETVVAKDPLMDTGIEHERVNVGEQGVEEVLAEPLALFLVE